MCTSLTWMSPLWLPSGTVNWLTRTNLCHFYHRTRRKFLGTLSLAPLGSQPGHTNCSSTQALSENIQIRSSISPDANQDYVTRFLFDILQPMGATKTQNTRVLHFTQLENSQKSAWGYGNLLSPIRRWSGTRYVTLVSNNFTYSRQSIGEQCHTYDYNIFDFKLLFSHQRTNESKFVICSRAILLDFS